MSASEYKLNTLKKTALYRVLLLVCLASATHVAYAQSTDYEQNAPAEKTKKYQSKASKIEDAYKQKDDYAVAKNYESLADDFYKSGDVGKAEAYYRKAEPIYEKLGKKDDLARVLRSLARSQEWQKRGSEAKENYRRSSEAVPASVSSNSIPQRSRNDEQRLDANTSNDVKEELSQQNVQLAQNEGDKDGTAESYSQLADVQMAQNKLPEAVQNYQNAVQVAETPELAFRYSEQLSNVYAANGQINQAIQVQQNLLDRADIRSDAPQKIAVFNQMASLYAKAESKDEALHLFRQSYDLALVENRTLDAKKSLENMAALLREQGKMQQAIDLYRDFVAKLDSLLPSDKTLIDNQLFAETEARITQLETEKRLQDELIARQTKMNRILIGAALLFALLAAFIARALYAIRKKNKEIALQSLRREMNPHFIFNSLNSVNQFIAQNDELAANKYLTAYSQLMRSTMEHSNKDFVRLSEELEMVRKYLELEKQRFSQQFDYQVLVGENLDPDVVEVPNMLIQPHLENAIWHGLRYLDHKGLLVLEISKTGAEVLITITDDGIGLTKSKELKTRNQQMHQSRGMQNTHERIDLLNQLYSKQIKLEVRERSAPETGTQVSLSFQAR
jgi:two-component system, sensor histidine kinase YesM